MVGCVMYETFHLYVTQCMNNALSMEYFTQNILVMDKIMWYFNNYVKCVICIVCSMFLNYVQFNFAIAVTQSRNFNLFSQKVVKVESSASTWFHSMWFHSMHSPTCVSCSSQSVYIEVKSHTVDISQTFCLDFHHVTTCCVQFGFSRLFA